MSPRKRSVPDQHVIAAAARTAARHGAESVRLADVAVESGLAAATLIQRFGSREGLLEAVGSHFISQVAEAFSIPGDSELDRLIQSLLRLEIPAHLTFFAQRPGHAAAYSLEVRKHIAFSLMAAVEAGELAPCDVAGLARRIQLSYYGAAAAAQLEGVPLDDSFLLADLDSYR